MKNPFQNRVFPADILKGDNRGSRSEDEQQVIPAGCMVADGTVSTLVTDLSLNAVQSVGLV